MSPAESTESSVRRVVVDFNWVSIFVVAGAVLGGLALLAVARAASDALTGLAIGIVIALALDPVVVAVRRRTGWRRGAAVAVVGAGLVAVFAGMIAYLGPRAVDHARQFSSELPDTVRELEELPLIGSTLERNDAEERVTQWIDDLPASITDETIADTADRLLTGILGALIVAFTALAVLLDGELLIGRVRRLLPARYRERADEVGRELYRTIGQYFGGSLTVASLMGIYVLTIGLAFGVPLAPIAALWAMLTDLIPQVGGFLGGALLGVLALAASPTTAIIVLLLFVLYMNLENHIIAPAIVGDAVNLTPPTTMLAAFIGGAAAGVPGALVATPLVGAAKRLYLRTRFGIVDPDEKPQGLISRVRARFT